ncbi:MAG: tetratricopeptide repeat protein [Myxococcota bacterium]
MDSDQVGPDRRATPSPTDRASLEQGRRAFERGDDEAALLHLERVVASGLRFADVFYRIGLVHERRGDLDAAATSLREAIRINPAYVEALLALASVCERVGDYDQARGLAERAGQLSRPGAGGLDPTTRGKLSNQQAALADALASAGLRREAIEQYRQALERCPTYHDIRHRLGITLREAGLPFHALQEFERILDARPGLLESRIQLGLTCYAMGRTDEARRAWQEVLAVDPTRREAAMYLRLVEAGEAPTDGARSRRPSTPDRGRSAPAPSAWSTIPLATAPADRADERAEPAGGALGAFLE